MTAASPIRFALNHMVAPRLGLDAFLALAASLGIAAVEIRNDLAGLPVADGTPAREVRKAAADAGMELSSLNALQKFNLWSPARADEARRLADYCAEAGVKALVLVAANDGPGANPAARIAATAEALAGLAPILSARRVTGLIECLGFASSSLRLKSEALAALARLDDQTGFRLLHDTFHHHLAGEAALFPARTGLVHISGVEEAGVSVADMRDGHRVLVGPRDRLGNLTQIVALRAGGYAGPFSFEPFAAELANLADPAAAIRNSMAFIEAAVAETTA